MEIALSIRIANRGMRLRFPELDDSICSFWSFCLFITEVNIIPLLDAYLWGRMDLMDAKVISGRMYKEGKLGEVGKAQKSLAEVEIELAQTKKELAEMKMKLDILPVFR